MHLLTYHVFCGLFFLQWLALSRLLLRTIAVRWLGLVAGSQTRRTWSPQAELVITAVRTSIAAAPQNLDVIKR